MSKTRKRGVSQVPGSRTEAIWKNPRIIIIIIIIIIIMGAAFIITQSVGNIRRGQYEERAAYGNVLTQQIATNVMTTIDQDWEFARYARSRAMREEFSSEAELLEYLQDVETDAERQVFFVRKDGHLLKADGEDAIWQAQSLLLTGKEEFYVSDTTMFGGSGVSNMYFVLPFSEPITAGTSSYTHLVMVQPISALDRFFEELEYSEKSLTFIVHRNGAQIYHSGRPNEISRAYNLLSLLKKARFSYGESYDSLKTAIQDGKNMTVLAKVNDTAYFVSEYHLGVADWIVMILVPESLIDSGTSMLTDTVSRNVINIFFSVLAVVLFLTGVRIVRGFQHQNRIQGELRDAAETQKKAADTERQASIAKTNFLSAMSHDIRTPMNAIVNYTDLAIKKKDDPLFVEDSLRKIQSSSQHLLTLINDVLDISRIESGRVAINPVSFDIRKLFEEIYEILLPRCEEYKVHLHRFGELPIPYLYGDTLRLKQIYLNILTNAIKYNVEGGSIDASVSEVYEEKEGRVRLIFVCKDTGIGIKNEFQDIMYENFARETDSRVNKIPGSGLGLSICKQLVELMDGTIVCESEENVGTTFTITLELPVVSPESSRALGGVVKSDAEWRELLSGTRVLVAEDNKINWNVLDILLKEIGIEAVRTKNGLECVETLLAAEENSFDTVLMDIRMPVMDGHEATRKIRNSGKPWLKTIPIIALSADAFEEDRTESRASGMNAHITKPLSGAILYQTLYSVLHEPERKEIES